MTKMEKLDSLKELLKHVYDRGGPEQKPVNMEGSKKQKTPTSLTEQVLVGLLNDLFSTCVFRSVPLMDESPISLTKTKPDSKKDRYMICLKWTKPEIFIQSISHKFTTFTGKPTPIQGKMTRYGEKSAMLSLGLSTSFRAYLKPFRYSNKIPVSILNEFLDVEINKGGMWAYNSLPAFLSSETKDTKEQAERRNNLLKITNEQLDEIQPSTIVSILWSLYFIQDHKRMHKLCMILYNEFMQNYQSDTKHFVYFLYLCRKMELIPNEKLEEIVYSKFNNVTTLETLTVPDVVILTNITNFSKNTTLTQKISTLLYYEIEHMSKECVVFLISGLTKMNFQFHLNDLFSKKLFSRLLAVYDEINSDEQLSVIFYTMSTLTYGVVGYLNELISKTLTRLHMLSSDQIVKIGLLYALAINTSLLADKLNEKKTEPKEVKDRILGKLESPVSTYIDDCLEFVFRQAAIKYKSPEADLLIMMNGLLVHTHIPSLSKKLDALGLEFGESWITTFKCTKRVTKYNKNVPKIDVNALEAQANNPAYSKCFKMFYLNLIDEFCNRTDDFKSETVDQIVFSLLTLNIDLSPIYEAVLISKGESIRQNVGFVEIRIVESDSMEEQYEMAREILTWSRAKEGIDVLKIGDTVVDSSPFAKPSMSVEVTSQNNVNEVKVDPVEKAKSDVEKDSEENIVEDSAEEVEETDKEEIITKKSESGLKDKKEPIKNKVEFDVKTKEEPVEIVESEESDEEDIVYVEEGDSSIASSEKSCSSSSVLEEIIVDTKKSKNKNKVKIEKPAKKEKVKEETVSKKKEDKKKKPETKEKVKESNIEDLIKMASKMDSSNLAPGNPVYDLIKKLSKKDSEDFDEKKVKKIGKYELLNTPSLEVKELKSQKSKESKNCKLSKLSKYRQTSEDWVNLAVESREPTKKGKKKDHKSHLDELAKKEDVFYKLKTNKKTRVELEKREVQIVYKYVKIKN